MKRTALRACLSIAGIGLCLTIRLYMSDAPLDEIKYRGERFKLAKPYIDYDDYKEDPDNFDPSEAARIEKILIEARISPEYPSHERMLRAVFGLRLPGYGLSSFGEKPQADGTRLAAFAIEIPRADKDRVLVFRGRGDAYTLIDDLVAPTVPEQMRVRLEGGQLIYSAVSGEPILVRPLSGD